MTVTEEATVAHSRSPFREYVGAAIGGTLLAVLALAGVTGYPWIALASFTAAGVVIALVDIRTRRLPNRYTGPYALAGALQAAAVSIVAAAFMRKSDVSRHNRRDTWIRGQSMGTGGREGSSRSRGAGRLDPCRVSGPQRRIAVTP